MADARLSVEIAADIRNVIAGMRQASQAVQTGASDIAASTGRAERSFTLLNNTRFNFGTNFQRSSEVAISASRALATQAATTGAALGGSVARGSNQAAFALTNLGRVAQDAPFGFIGIQNNLNPLLESFQRLRTESGSNAAALRALGSSLMGPAGIGIALSLVSAGILLYQKYLQGAKKATEEAAKTTEDYAKSLDQVTRAQLVGAQNAQDEIVKLRSLYAVTQNTSISLKQRKEAVNELQKQYPAYFKNISDEAILAGNAKTAYDNLATAIIATAKARAAQDIIVQNSKKQLENEQKITDLKAKQIKQEQELRQAKELDKVSSAGGTGSIGGLNVGTTQKVGRALDDIKENITEQLTLNAANVKITQQNLELTKSITAEVQKGADLAGKVGDLETERVKKKKKIRDYTKEANEFAANAAESLASANAKEAVDAQTKALQEYNDVLRIGNELESEFGNDAFVKAFADRNKTLVEQNAMLRSDFETSFGAIGEAIGTAFANGGNVIEAFGATVLSSIGDILVQFGKLSIAAGIASTALASALKNPFGGGGLAAIAAGIALVAVGSAVKGFSSKLGNGGGSGNSGGSGGKLPQFANGTNYAPGGAALVGERGPELVNLPTGSQVIPNHKLAGIGSGMSVNLAGKLEIGIDKLYFALEREARKQSRIA